MEYCNKEDLIKREQYYLELLNPEYNICTTAGSTLGKLHSEETKAKIAEAAIGRIHSEETKAKIAEAGIGRRHSEETKQKMSVYNSGQFKKGVFKAKPEGSGTPSQPIEVTDLQTSKKTTYDSMGEAARALDIPCSAIPDYFRKNQKKPYKLRYVFLKLT